MHEAEEGSIDTCAEWNWFQHSPAEVYKGHRVCLGLEYTKYINPIDVVDDMVHPDDMQVGISAHNGAQVQIWKNVIVDNPVTAARMPRMWKRYDGAVTVLEVQGIIFGSIMDVIQTNMRRLEERNAAYQAIVAQARE